MLYEREKDWGGYDLLIFPELYCASDELIGRIRTYVEQGGSVFASFRSFFADENLLIRHDRQPHGLTDVFGVHYDRFTRNAAHSWMELLEADGAEVLESYDDSYRSGYASFTHHRFGLGHAWYSGCTVEMGELKARLLRACETAGLQIPPYRFPIVKREQGGLHFWMNFSNEAGSFRLPFDGVDALTGAKYEQGSLIRLNAWAAVVMQAVRE